MLTKRNKVERMTIVNTLLTGIYEELLKGETDDIDGLLQIAVYAQVEMNRIVFDLNQRNGCEPIADTPQTDLLVKTPHKSRESHEKNCETCRDKDAYDEWEGNCDECENGSMYTPQTDCAWSKCE